MFLDRAGGDNQSFGSFPVGHALGNGLEDCKFPVLNGSTKSVARNRIMADRRRIKFGLQQGRFHAVKYTMIIGNLKAS